MDFFWILDFGFFFSLFFFSLALGLKRNVACEHYRFAAFALLER